MTLTPLSREPMHFDVLVPHDDSAVPVFHISAVGLRIALVERHLVGTLSDDWNFPGAYALLDYPTGNGDYGAYAGKGTVGVKSRVVNQARTRPHWGRAILVVRDTTYAFNSAHAGWLEGRLYDLLDRAEHAQLYNMCRPDDDTLSASQRAGLEPLMDVITRVLRVAGYSTAPAKAYRHKRKAPASRAGISMATLLGAGLIAVGDEVVSTYPAYPVTGRIVEGGRLEAVGQQFATPSRAGHAIRGKKTDGWKFWAVHPADGTRRRSLYELRQQYIEQRAARN